MNVITLMYQQRCINRGVIGGESTSAMSFHDFAHMLHRYGMMEYAGAGEGGGEGSVEGSAAKRVFHDAKRGNWQGGGNVRPS